jgi:hypothetical protein
MKNLAHLSRRTYLILGTVLVLSIAGCSSDDPFITSKANRENAQAEIERARAEDMAADTKIKLEQWGLNKNREEVKADVEIAALRSQAELAQAETDSKKARLAINTAIAREFATREKEAELERATQTFWVVVIGASVILATTLALGVDRYRVQRTKVIARVEAQLHQLHTELARATQSLKAEWSQVREAQQKFNQATADLSVAGTTLTSVRAEISAAEKELRLLKRELVFVQAQRVDFAIGPANSILHKQFVVKDDGNNHSADSTHSSVPSLG